MEAERPKNSPPLSIWLTVAMTVAVAAMISICATASAAEKPPAIEFETQVANILIRSCVGCHNASDPKGQLDLTSRVSMLRGGDSGAAVSPGSPDDSLMLERVTDGEMPPEGKSTALSPVEVATLRSWISQGANWPESRVLSSLELTTDSRAGSDWWSLQSVVRPQPPEVKLSAWVREPIDAFILLRLEQESLRPAAPADRVTYLRRAKFDLLGLPPTPAEMDAFLADTSPQAYQRLIDRLLASAHYGERWGRHWLDVIGYTESDGFEHDKFRPHAWRYRDYVINSFNADKPYSQFVIEQLAGDALPRPSSEAILATGFLVAGPWDEVQNVGASKNEMRRAREEQIAELIGSVSQTFLGMTVGCARCHDHKFDPVPQADYYRIKAVFDGVDHSQGRTLGNRPFYTPAQLKEHKATVAPLEARQKELTAELAQIDAQLPSDAVVSKLDKRTLVEGRFGKALDARRASATVKSNPAFHTPPLTVELWAKAHSKLAFNVFIANQLKSSGDHWELYSYHGQGDFSVYMPGYQPAVIRSGVDITDGRWRHLAMQFDGSQIRLFVDGQQVKSQDVKRVKPEGTLGDLVIGGYPPQKIGCDGAVDEVRISNFIRPIESLPQRAPVADDQTVGLWRFDRADSNRFTDHSQPAGAPDRQLLRIKRAEITAEIENVTRQIASHSLPLAYIGFRRQPEPTFVLLRGDVKTPGVAVTACGLSTIRVPSPQFSLTQNTPEAQRRLKFAQWVASPENPLTARVMVNRVWQHHFGSGLVKMPSDFGFNGGRASHPQLLDWLADEFVRGGWSLKRLHRTIMLSATYRQSSRFNELAASADADNRLLWRATPRRLEGEIVRDAMLATSGELNSQLGGASFQPFTVTIFNTHFYNLFDSDRPDFNRRAIYRANVITGRDPLLDSLDCPSPSIASPRRMTTVTPLQALSLMNDTFVVRQAQRFAQRVRNAAGDNLDAQITLAFRLALARTPTPQELAATKQVAQDHDLSSVCWALINSSEFLYVR